MIISVPFCMYYSNKKLTKSSRWVGETLNSSPFAVAPLPLQALSPALLLLTLYVHVSLRNT